MPPARFLPTIPRRKPCAGNGSIFPAGFARRPFPCPVFLALGRLAAHDRFGHEAYLNGQVSTHGWWYYFPELLAVKSTLGFLAALAIASLLALVRRQWRDWPTCAILIPAGIFLAAAMAGNIDIGIRYILPAIPFLYLFIAAQLARPRWGWLLACLILCSAVETAAVHPDYLSFFNIAAGGPSRGQRFALDSNLDWNQDVYRLADWIRATPPAAHTPSVSAADAINRCSPRWASIPNRLTPLPTANCFLSARTSDSCTASFRGFPDIRQSRTSATRLMYMISRGRRDPTSRMMFHRRMSQSDCHAGFTVDFASRHSV